MFETRLFLAIAGVSVIALMIGAPLQTHAWMVVRIQQGLPVPSRRGLLLVGATLQQSALVIGAAALGTLLAPRIGLHAPVFEALVQSTSIWAAVRPQLLPAITAGLGVTAVFLVLYYRLFRPRLDAVAVQRTERLRCGMGLGARVLMGGIVEEVMFRWGVMTFFAWLGSVIVDGPNEGGIWVAIVLAGIIFGLGHLPGVAAVGVTLTRQVVMTALVLNLLVAVVFGWLFWQYGLFAAMLAHGLLHVVWWPFERCGTHSVAIDRQAA